MVVGHFAAGLSAKRLSQPTPLAWLIAAPAFVDLLWPLLLLIGVERVRIDPGNTAFTPLAFDYYPWTHSLVMGVVWGAVLGAAARLRGLSPNTAMVVGALVVSHWVLDFVTHKPDLPLAPWMGGTYGLGLWRSIPATLAVEGALWAAGIVVFLRFYRPRGVQGRIAFWSFVLVASAIWISGPFSPPPPDVRTLALAALSGWIIVPWAWWIDRTTEARPIRS